MDICTSYHSCSVMSSCETISQESSSSPGFNNSKHRNNSKSSEPTLVTINDNGFGNSLTQSWLAEPTKWKNAFFGVPQESEILTRWFPSQKSSRKAYFYESSNTIKHPLMGLSASLVQACSLGRYRPRFKSGQPHQSFQKDSRTLTARISCFCLPGRSLT